MRPPIYYWDVIRWLIVVIFGAGMLHARIADVPAIKNKLDATESRVTRLEQAISDITKGVDRSNEKLDRLLYRVHR